MRWLLVFIVFLAGCELVSPGASRVSNDPQGTVQPVATYGPAPAPTSPPAPPPTAVVTIPTARPAAPAPTATVQLGSTTNWTDFAKLVAEAGPYGLIAALDRHLNKVSMDQGGFTLSAGQDEAVIFWTGRYDVSDITDGGRTIPWKVDGKTGIFVLKPGQTIVVSSPSGVLRLKGVTQDALDKLGQGPSPTTGCLETAKVTALINQHKKTNPGRIYTGLDELASQNAQASFRSLEPTSTINGQPLMTLVWIRSGKISDPAVMPLDSHEGKTLYIVTKTATMKADYQHRGVQLCTDLNPARDFPWWGK